MSFVTADEFPSADRISDNHFSEWEAYEDAPKAPDDPNTGNQEDDPQTNTNISDGENDSGVTFQDSTWTPEFYEASSVPCEMPEGNSCRHVCGYSNSKILGSLGIVLALAVLGLHVGGFFGAISPADLLQDPAYLHQLSITSGRQTVVMDRAIEAEYGTDTLSLLCDSIQSAGLDAELGRLHSELGPIFLTSDQQSWLNEQLPAMERSCRSIKNKSLSARSALLSKFDQAPELHQELMNFVRQARSNDLDEALAELWVTRQQDSVTYPCKAVSCFVVYKLFDHFEIYRDKHGLFDQVVEVIGAWREFSAQTALLFNGVDDWEFPAAAAALTDRMVRPLFAHNDNEAELGRQETMLPPTRSLLPWSTSVRASHHTDPADLLLSKVIATEQDVLTELARSLQDFYNDLSRLQELHALAMPQHKDAAPIVGLAQRADALKPHSNPPLGDESDPCSSAFTGSIYNISNACDHALRTGELFATHATPIRKSSVSRVCLLLQANESPIVTHAAQWRAHVSARAEDWERKNRRWREKRRV